MAQRTAVEAHFLSKTTRGSHPDSCWEWIGEVNTTGYGRLRLVHRGKLLLVHRLSYQLYRGPIPAGLQVLHTCDNTRCINPGHLFLGTKRDNMLDMHRKNRHSARKLTDAQVIEIRKQAVAGATQRQLANMFKISQPTVHRVVTGKNHSQVE